MFEKKWHGTTLCDKLEKRRVDFQCVAQKEVVIAGALENDVQLQPKDSMQKSAGPLTNVRKYSKGRIRSMFSTTYEIYGNEKDF